MVLVIDNYDSFTYNLVQYLGELGATPRGAPQRRNVSGGDSRPRTGADCHLAGPGRPENAGISLDVIRAFGPELPILGVCLGHQAIGLAFGGRVVRAPLPFMARPRRSITTIRACSPAWAPAFRRGAITR